MRKIDEYLAERNRLRQSAEETQEERRLMLKRQWLIGALSSLLILVLNEIVANLLVQLTGRNSNVLDISSLMASTLCCAGILLGARLLIKRHHEMAAQLALPLLTLATFLVLLALVALVWSLGGNFGLRKSGFQFADYGLGFFVFNPLALGFIPALVFAISFRPLNRRLYGAAMVSLLVSILIMSAAKFEGGICLLLALPLEIPLVCLGAFIGKSVANSRYFSTPYGLGSIALLAPLALGIGGHARAPWNEHTVRTEQIVYATPDQIWPLLLKMDALPAPDWWLFRAGVAYPVAISAAADRIGAERICRLSTGPMLETIDKLEPNHKLGFRVDSTPPTMRESNPFGSIHPPHLTNTFKCLHGEITLEPLPGGRTRMVGVSVYTQSLAPDLYWSKWCDMVVHEVHSHYFDAISERFGGR